MGYVIKKKNDTSIVSRFGLGRNQTGDAVLVGGKGSKLAEMVDLGMNVPSGFTFTTEACLKVGDPNFLSHLKFHVRREYLCLARHLGYAPLVSVRSGARVSMPGMMDTVLNVGMSDAALPYWTERIGKAAALDCYRRLVIMYGNVVRGVEFNATASKTLDSAKYQYKMKTGEDFPQDLITQLTSSVEAVFSSWGNERAIAYRNDAIQKGQLPEDCHGWGTACNVQTMVFGNRNDESGSGVLFTRDASSGAPEIMAEFLQNAQGEDVVAGTRTPLNLDAMCDLGGDWPAAHINIQAMAEKLESHYNDAQDIEFTVENGELFVLQTRSAKRTGLAAIRIARDFVKEGRITKTAAFSRLSPQNFAAAQVPQISPKYKAAPLFTGNPACPGVVTGVVALSSKAAVKLAKKGNVILVSQDTEPNDLPGMLASVGVLTAVGGKTSHAAVVAREKNIPTVCGAGFGADDFTEGKTISIDGTSGKVWLGKVPTISGAEDEAVSEVIDWAFEVHDVPRRGTVVDRPNMIVEATAWIGSPKDEKVSLARIKKLKDRSGIVLDVSLPSQYRREADFELWGMFGAEKVDTPQGIALVDRLVEAKLEGTMVKLHKALSNETERLQSAGYVVAREVTCLEDVVMTDGPLFGVDAPGLNTLMADKALKKVIEMREKLGEPVSFLHDGMTTVEAIEATFKGK